MRSIVEILCISNGHGEDIIAARICLELQKLGFSPMALPLVGVGNAYKQADIPIANQYTQAMPSGGFVRMDSRQLARDMKSGLVGLTRRQLGFVWQWSRDHRKSQKLVLAVGDIVPLLFAWLPSQFGGSDFAFVATAKSEYYWRDRQNELIHVKKPFGGSIFFPWERSLMKSHRCKAVFVRDLLTSEYLNQKFKLPAIYLGNSMMDGLEPQGIDFGIGEDDWVVAVLMGSRSPEAYENWITLMPCAQLLARNIPHQVHFLVAIAPSLDMEKIVQSMLQKGWQRIDEYTFKVQNARIILTQNGFNDCLHQCHFGLAMAGTATEQLVGLGKPVITLAGNGPQFTRRFAEEQADLLGCSVNLIDKPAQVVEVLNQMLKDPDYFQEVGRNARERMGQSGASQNIAKYLHQQLNQRSKNGVAIY
ncbi:MAG: lipid-A-disaccharide synthase-related protein [Pseudanabaenaceae cyanobacterium bins.39]|nr:lipid-A-disaccharide synthase-related protein [Pseudanabaenaceae cyanobacterium bins.39]